MSQVHLQPPPPTHMMRDLVEAADPKFWTALPDQPGLPRGDGHAVLFAPGIFTGDFATASLRAFIANLGYATHGWGLGINVGPTRRATRGIEQRLFALNDRTGRRVSLVGLSLGGVYVRELAKRYPDRVRHLFLVCSPTRHPVASRIEPLIRALEALYDPSFPRSPEALSRPADVPTTAFYTRRDGFIAWQCCLESGPLAENIEVDSGHCIAGRMPLALRVMATRLAEPDLDRAD
jgi:pimeloyl-ACP methyl ester carboxylesterase